MDLFNNRDVLLVGNSKSILGRGAIIDSFDFVVRFNNAISFMGYQPPSKIGTKFDVWVYAMADEKYCSTLYNSARIKPLYSIRYSNQDVYTKKLGNSYLIDREILHPIIKKELELGEHIHPSSGLAVLFYLVNYTSCSSISLIGFDSFLKPNFYATKQWASLWHDKDKEAAYLARLKEDGKIAII